MPRMPVTKRLPEDPQMVVLGPCPGCYAWTIEYNLDVVHRERVELSETVEALLQEHLLECAGMREIVESP